MKWSDSHLLNEWKIQLSEFNKNDALVSLDRSKTHPFQESYSWSEINKILSISQNSIKDNGINPLCWIKSSFRWKLNNEEITSPLWIVPCDFKVDKVRQIVHVTPIEEELFINPFLIKKWDELYDLKLENSTIDDVLITLSSAGIGEIDNSISVIGNVHHHRHLNLKELEEILQHTATSANLLKFLTGEKSENHLPLRNESILDYDTDHQTVFHILEHDNCVVQGPPGTGKSQLLTNILAKALGNQQTTLVVSEKRAALEVIVKRMKTVGLDAFCCLMTEEINTHTFLQNAKKTWLFLEQQNTQTHSPISVRQEVENNLQFTLDLLNQEELIGGISYHQFIQLAEGISLDSSFELLANPPSLINITKELPLIEQLYQLNTNKSVTLLPISTWQNSSFESIIEQLEQTEQQLKKLSFYTEQLTYAELEQLQREQVIYQLFDTAFIHQFEAIYKPSSKEQNRFLKCVEKHQKITRKIKEFNLSEWKEIPSELELISLKQQLNTTNWFKKIKVKKRWSMLQHLPVEKAEVSIEKLLEYKKLEYQNQQTTEKLIELGIENWEQAKQIKASLFLYSQHHWDAYQKISNVNKQLFQQYPTAIQQLKQQLSFNYRLDEGSSISEQLLLLKKQLPLLIEYRHQLAELQKDHLIALQKSTTFERYKLNLINSHYTHFKSLYPLLSQFKMDTLLQKVDALHQANQEEQLKFAQELIQQQQQLFKQYEQLIATPSTKLTEEQKTLKTQLKKGKSILVKEFGKNKSHPSIRKLLESEARSWIQLLHPIWLTNPTQLAKSFPLETDLFDWCIIDEASQLPASNSVGALFRTKRSIIAGDAQQMQPSSYFKAKSDEITSTIHHASYYLKNYQLKHHYRSQQVPLIAFSNTHFYDNQLLVFPSYPINSNCVQAHYCEEGQFIHRRNTIEAKKVVALLQTKLQTNKTIGVVAFSQEQVNAILEACSPELLHQIEQGIEEGRFFIQPLEKVQGDECEQLIISMAYGKDEDGNYQKHFGPLNTSSGRNRLNVLLTRASESIDFVYSYPSKELQWNENSSIDLLYKWLCYIEAETTHLLPEFPFHINPVIEGNKLTISAIYHSIQNARELLVFTSVLKKRGWQIELKA